jgi:lipopolysaccharide/colanic/teichoic acid biosynthesis glycosyltransferase
MIAQPHPHKLAAPPATPTATAAWPFRLHVIPLPDDVHRDPLLLRAVYRTFELALALVITVVAAPIMLLEAIVIRLDSPGPALFRQRRMGRSAIVRGADLVGRNDLIPPPGGFEPERLYLVPQTITFVKFRTMHVDARERFPELYNQQFSSHDDFMRGYYKLEKDPRVTRAGRLLRRTTVDELPNLFLVLSGKMRLVGPRPEDQRVKHYLPEQMIKFMVTPGVTGLAQSSGRGRLPIGEQIACDLEYVRNRSVWLDVQILWRTFVGVIRQRGAF